MKKDFIFNEVSKLKGVGPKLSKYLKQKKIEQIKDKEKLEEKKQIEFSEKIDELNQETETLLDEIDKWQM